MNGLKYTLLNSKIFHCQIRTTITTFLLEKNLSINFDKSRIHILFPVCKQELTFNGRKGTNCFSSTSEKYLYHRKITRELKHYFEKNKLGLQDAEYMIKEKRKKIIKDIKDTKNKVKEKVDEIIEKENIYTIPNFLCVSRILVSPYLSVLILQAEFNYALAILGIAAVTDLLDGWIARTWESQSSKMGSFLDPMADKVLIGTLFLSLTYADLIPVQLTSIILGRDIVLIVAGFIIRYRSLPPPITLSRYFDASHATVQLAPTFISKMNTVIQLILVGSTLAAPVFHYVDHPMLQSLWYITGVTTIAAGMSYLLSKNTYHYLRKK